VVRRFQLNLERAAFALLPAAAVYVLYYIYLADGKAEAEAGLEVSLPLHPVLPVLHQTLCAKRL
tara:strand:- start:154 stop:345 length:192 start_codon:yes stop_codon:yes gene_type:complete